MAKKLKGDFFPSCVHNYANQINCTCVDDVLSTDINLIPIPLYLADTNSQSDYRFNTSELEKGHSVHGVQFFVLKVSVLYN